MKAIETSGTAVGVRCRDGVILAVEKLIAAPMLVEGTARRIAAVDVHMGAAVAGWYPDARQLITLARDEAAAYKSAYGERASVEMQAERMGAAMHIGTIAWYMRPYGAAMLLAGYDEDKKVPELYCIEPTGACLRYFGCALGKGARAAKTEIEKRKLSDKTCMEALGEIAKILHTVHDDTKDKPMEIEMSWISEASGWRHQFIPKDVQAEAITWAKAQIAAEEMGSDDDDDE
jgi:20S proteasome subunit alpha 7